MGRSTAVCFAVVLAAALAACDQGVKPPASSASAGPKCAAGIDRTVSFTAAQAKDRLIVEALGPDCKNPAMSTRIYDPSGRLVFSNTTSGQYLMGDLFPQAGGTAQGVAENLIDIGPPGAMQLPEWRDGAAEPPATEYGAFKILVPQPAYERLRRLGMPTMILRGGAESGTVYIYDRENGTAVAIVQYAV
jgi:hypothetical protein